MSPLSRIPPWLNCVAAIALLSSRDQVAAEQYDVVIYGGTSAGVIAAVEAKRLGKSVILVSPDKHLGGMTSGGLGWTDIGDKSTIGGLAREFYHRIWQHYQKDAAWPWQPRDKFGNTGQGTAAVDGANRTMWVFEPNVAEQIFEDFVREHDIPVHRDEWLDREHGVTKAGPRIVSITTLSGKTFPGKMFIDATYEGDLMAAAGVSYTVGRESQQTYNEKWNGIQTGVLHHKHHFGILDKPVDPFVVPGDPSSSIIPLISPDPPGEYGAADRRIQAYCFRMCLTNVPENRIPIPRPPDYDPKQYELLARIYATGWRGLPYWSDPIPNHKTDSNNFGPLGTDDIGANYDYPAATYERRRKIIAEHQSYQQGLLYFLAIDDRVSAEVRKKANEWGLAKDEFTDNNNWPRQLYIREARRMIGDYVMTENDILKRRPTPKPIGMGSYTMDSHNVQRYVAPDNHVQNEGDIGIDTDGPYQIAYGALVPKRNECENLLVPVCLSSSHIAYGSIRMEPVFMILGQSAATAAAQAINDNTAVQDIDYERLSTQLRHDGQILRRNNDD